MSRNDTIQSSIGATPGIIIFRQAQQPAQPAALSFRIVYTGYRRLGFICDLEFGTWYLFGIWNLELGIYLELGICCLEFRQTFLQRLCYAINN